METKTMLEQLTGAIEQALKGAGSPKPSPTRKMTPEGLLEHALAEIQKAAKEQPDRAKRRMATLARAVETAKQAFVDTGSETIEVEVFQEETTAQQDRSEKETSPVALEAAVGNSAFAQNAEDLNKALAKLQKELEGLRAPGNAGAARTGDDKVQKGAGEPAWPFDMNSRAFREGVKKAEDAPAWGFDPGREEQAEKA